MNQMLKDYLVERDKALIALDMDWARRIIQENRPGEPIDDEVLLMGMHKTRYNVPSVARELRLASAEWLRERGFGDLHGMPLLPPGELP